jgi:2-phosphosulfolactate phosphatase
VVERDGAEIAVRREQVSQEHRFSLSPVTFLKSGPGDRIALPSPNGAACCRAGAAAPAVLIACLLNSTAAARAALLLTERHGADLTVLACGERWHEGLPAEQLRFALEDYLGAGALLSALELPCSPDAAVCRAAFLACAPNLNTLLADCPSGVELRERGYPEDVEHAAQRDICDVVPFLIDGRLIATTSRLLRACGRM